MFILQNEQPRDSHQQRDRKERYFGESDRESLSRRRLNESSGESATEVDGMGPRAPSLVYLHTAAGTSVGFVTFFIFYCYFVLFFSSQLHGSNPILCQAGPIVVGRILFVMKQCICSINLDLR